MGIVIEFFVDLSKQEFLVTFILKQITHLDP